MIKKEKIDEILDKTDIVDVISRYLPGLRKLGKNYKTLCPFHGEKTPSFTVSADKQMFFCFGCQTGGDAITFVMKIENITFSEAAKKLADKAGVLLDEKDFKKISQSDLEKVELKKAVSAAAAFFARYLKSKEGSQAVKYLQGRGIKEETVRSFQIGLAPNSWDALIIEFKSLGISVDIARKAGLLAARENGEPVDLFRDRIMFPIKSFNGDTIAFGGRTNGQATPKYLNSPETPLFSKRNALYGLYQASPTMRKIKKAVIVEGYMDVIALHQYGLTFAVSPLGTSLTQNQCLVLKRYCEEAIVMFDPDWAGINAAIKASDQLVEAGIYPKICLLDQGKDPDEFLVEKGAEAFYEKLQTAKDPIEFKIDLVKKDANSMGPKDKSKTAAFLRETIVRQKDEIIKNEWAKKISQELSIPETLLLSSASAKKQIQQESPDYGLSGVPPVEKGFVHILLKNPSLAISSDGFSSQFLTSNFARTIYSELSSSSGKTTLKELADKYPQYAGAIMAIAVEEIATDIDPVTNLRETKKMLLENYYRNRWKEMKKRLSTLNIEELEEFNELSKIIKK
ncbi:MAG: hypothetical protein Fur0012_05830 [Elusimicrobiota bacterium]